MTDETQWAMDYATQAIANMTDASPIALARLVAQAWIDGRISGLSRAQEIMGHVKDEHSVKA